MATTLGRNCCATCGNVQATSRCKGCSQDFCNIDNANHRQQLRKELEEIEVKRIQLHRTCGEQISNLKTEALVQEINKWEQDSINQIHQRAEEARQGIIKHNNENISELETKFIQLTEQLQQSRQNNDFYETNLRQWNEDLIHLSQILAKLVNINIRYDSTSFVTKLSVDADNSFSFSSNQTPTSSVKPATDSNQTKYANTIKYEETLSKAQEYEKRYTAIDISRKNQLASRTRDFMNKLGTGTFESLAKDIFDFLNGQEHKIAGQNIRILNNDERLLCLSILSTLILNQLLGGDLDTTKANFLLPLVSILSENPLSTEFSTIFLEYLYKKCSYTIPSYPKPTPTMTKEEYLRAMGYIKKQDGAERRFETEIEFLNRMTGLIRFFCKLLVRGGPPFDANLSIAWAWCASLVNLPPESNISSVLLRIFLDEAGEKMMKQYPKQFPKIVQYIQMQFLPRLEKVTTKDEIVRFQLTLETFLNK